MTCQRSDAASVVIQNRWREEMHPTQRLQLLHAGDRLIGRTTGGQCHNPPSLSFVQGLVKAVGVSNYGPKQMLKIYQYLEGRGVPLASAQVRILPRCSSPELFPFVALLLCVLLRAVKSSHQRSDGVSG